MKESYETLRRKMAQTMALNQRSLGIQKFGSFILQTNKIQFYLSRLVILRSSYPDKEYVSKIESMTLGQVVNLFCACAQKETGEFILIPKLRKHNKIRNKFVHKVLIDFMPNDEDLKNAIELGNEIITSLIYIFNAELINRK